MYGPNARCDKSLIDSEGGRERRRVREEEEEKRRRKEGIVLR